MTDADIEKLLASPQFADAVRSIVAQNSPRATHRPDCWNPALTREEREEWRKALESPASYPREVAEKYSQALASPDCT
ncbi:MAG: hypothetical protein FD119_123 [Stygiobacter sp.]|nr:MAG: hypothetical protein FD119_123 [Stygiobacter sp.]